MTKVVILLVGMAFLFSGCDKRRTLTRAEIIEGVQECNDGGMSAWIQKTPWGGRQVGVICLQRRGSR